MQRQSRQRGRKRLCRVVIAMAVLALATEHAVANPDLPRPTATGGEQLNASPPSSELDAEAAAHKLADKFSQAANSTRDDTTSKAPENISPSTDEKSGPAQTVTLPDIPAPDRAKLEALIDEAEDVAAQAAAAAKIARDQAANAERKAYEKDLLRRARAEAEREASDDAGLPTTASPTPTAPDGDGVQTPEVTAPSPTTKPAVAKAQNETKEATSVANAAKREAERMREMARQRQRESDILAAKLKQVREQRARLEALGDKLKEWPAGPNITVPNPRRIAKSSQRNRETTSQPSVIATWPGLMTWDTPDPDAAAPDEPSSSVPQPAALEKPRAARPGQTAAKAPGGPNASAAPKARADTPADPQPPKSARATASRSRTAAGEVAILLKMKPGRRGIRRWRKTADPMICLTDHCYVSMGAARAAGRLRRSRAFGPGIALGIRAGRCSNSLTCVFRGIDLDRDGVRLQPIDLRLIRHDRRKSRRIAALSDCEIADDRLSCTGAVDGGDWVAWVVPEAVAEKLSERALSAALDGLPATETAAR